MLSPLSGGIYHRKFLKNILFFLCVSAGNSIFFASFLPTKILPLPIAEAKNLPAKTVVRLPKKRPVPAGVPDRLTIPRLNISSSIQDVGTLPDGKLDVPDDRNILGWYRDGARPGQEGTAIIDGHLRTAAGPGAFWTLKRLRPKDVIHVTDNHGNIHSFRVRETAVYDVSTAPLNKIFGTETAGKNLTLITCAGKWSKVLNHYDKRLVIYSDLIIEEKPTTLISTHTTSPR